MVKLFLSAVIALAVFNICSATIFSRCGLVRELRRQGFPENDMRNWVCLVENESGKNTSKKSHQNNDGSYDYGLFQINDRYWCSNTDTPGKDCHIKCSDLLTNDITIASNCAKMIYQREGFRAWYRWRNHCQGSLPDISDC